MAAEDKIIGVVLIQEIEGKEHIITNISQRLIDAQTRYTFIEKLWLSLYYACTKLRPYLLSSTYILVCQTDVIKHIYVTHADFEWLNWLIHFLNMI